MKEIFQEIRSLFQDLNIAYLNQYVDDLEKSIDKVHIAFVGEYNAGKSSLINTLIGQNVLAERDLPTTNRVVLVTNCDIVQRKKLDKFTELLCIDEPRLENIVLVDTPGLSSAVKEHEAALFKYLHKADLLVFVAPSLRPYTKEIENLLKELMEKHSTQLAYVINIFEDPTLYLEDPKKIDRLKEFVREKLSQFLSSEDVKDLKIFTFNLRLVRKGDKRYPELVKEFEEFKKFIFDEVAEKAKKLKFASIKEKLLKLLSSREIQEKKEKFKNLQQKLSTLKAKKESINKLAEQFKQEELQNIEKILNTFFQQLQEEIEEILARYSNIDFVKNPLEVQNEIKTLIKSRFLVEDYLELFSNLLDYRSALVRIKKIYPDVVLNLTIPSGRQNLIRNFERDIENLPTSVGLPGNIAKWVLVIGFLFTLIGAILVAAPGLNNNENLKQWGIVSIILGILLGSTSFIRLIMAKNSYKKLLENRIKFLKSHYLNLFKERYQIQYDEKIKNFNIDIDKEIKKIELQLNNLKDILDRVELLKEKIVKY
jgi:GTPase Era involved in 16S rRNA processing